MNSNEIRQSFLDYFESKNHKVIPSSSLIPHDNSLTERVLCRRLRLYVEHPCASVTTSKSVLLSVHNARAVVRAEESDAVQIIDRNTHLQLPLW